MGCQEGHLKVKAPVCNREKAPRSIPLQPSHSLAQAIRQSDSESDLTQGLQGLQKTKTAVTYMWGWGEGSGQGGNQSATTQFVPKMKQQLSRNERLQNILQAALSYETAASWGSVMGAQVNGVNKADSLAHAPLCP